ncbi:SDR family NAD(P)-dependent oxidoreductase [Streptomyces nogalater]
MLPGMRARGSGVIVNVSSLAARTFAVPHGGFYAASKAALGALSEALYAEVQPFGVRVVCLEPGSFATAIQRASRRRRRRPRPGPAPTRRTTPGWTGSSPGWRRARPTPPRRPARSSPRPTTPRPLHTVVGEDARAALEFLDGVSYEQWLPRFLEQAQALAGPRPAGPR